MTIITSENFESEVLQAGKSAVVDFWATWCGPCMMLAPVMEQLEEELPQIKFCKVNVDEQMELAIRFRVESIPTLLLVKDGKVQEKLIGFREKAALKALLEAKL